MELDHIVLGTPDLQKSMLAFHETSGCLPVIGGSHKTLGTKNALAVLVLESPTNSYIEVIGPDIDSEKDSRIRSDLAGLSSLFEVHHFFVRADLNDIRNRATSLGFSPSDILDLSRLTPEGKLLQWRLVYIMDHGHGGVVPCFIDWGDCPHPTTTTHARLGRLVEFKVTAPSNVLELLQGLGSIKLEQGDIPSLHVAFESPNGLIQFATDRPIGFRFELPN